MPTERIWYLVMNSNRARILRGLPHPHEAAAAELVLQSRHHKLRDHLEDRPTRSYSAGSPGRRSAVEPSSDPVKEDTVRFLKEVIAFMTGELQAQAFDGFVVVAPPEVLGLWRDELAAPLMSAVHREVPRNFVRMSSHDLIEALRDVPRAAVGSG